ncbi:patatin-like phospholipase family protein [candidate division KSB1 bacterium]|nr:patatin-like phospholipase family protein [candidate division KSB1 bacterium]
MKNGKLALVLTGGGARAAYQVGFLQSLAKHFPDLQIPIITGMSAGAINASFIANHPGSCTEAIQALTEIWNEITPEKIFRVDTRSLLTGMFKSIVFVLLGAGSKKPRIRSLVDTNPLREFLQRHLKTEKGQCNEIENKLNIGSFEALAITTTNYMTGQTITWTQGCSLQNWRRPNQVSRKTRFTIDHVMASAAIPVFFPAVKIGNEWHGDGGIRLYSPLSPAIHLGADRILAISTRYTRSKEEADLPVIRDYPPPSQIAGILMNAIFLDSLDQDADRLERINRLLRELPEEKRDGRRLIELFILRPTVDLGKLSLQFEPKLPPLFRYLMRKQGSRKTTSPDWLSMVMFQKDYLHNLIELGEKDAEDKFSEIESFLS